MTTAKQTKTQKRAAARVRQQRHEQQKRAAGMKKVTLWMTEEEQQIMKFLLADLRSRELPVIDALQLAWRTRKPEDEKKWFIGTEKNVYTL